MVPTDRVPDPKNAEYSLGCCDRDALPRDCTAAVDELFAGVTFTCLKIAKPI